MQAGAQESKFKTKGGITGYGNAFSDNTYYKIFYLAADFSSSFKPPKKNDFVGWYFEPQFNFVHTLRPFDYEFGANLGIRNYIRISPDFYLYQMLGSGPHYISAELDRQATGFIFSDNLAIGSFMGIGKKSLFLNLQFRMRHISNANLKLPNRGVNSYNFLVGFSCVDPAHNKRGRQ
ncbi:MAG TPA: acyloxyacyl hydrolase [Flavisolibacter sp.]|nr:acyloxyacyl hydrolase [Flavisolibacter sp.]